MWYIDICGLVTDQNGREVESLMVVPPALVTYINSKGGDKVPYKDIENLL